MTFSTLEKPTEWLAASELSDGQLFQRCRDYGEKALHWKRKFTGLLPEVERRRLWESHGFGSVFEFAFKLAGLSEQQVRTALNLDRREAELEKKKTELVAVGGSRYVPVAVKKVLQEEHGSKCSIPGCAKVAREIHHTRRFSLSRSHDPHYLAPLCKEYHQLAHYVDQGYRNVRLACRE